jgi:hypothetical protein
LGEGFVWTDLDPNKTLIDFFTYLKVWPERSVEPHTLAQEEPTYHLSVFSYPALLTFATLTTLKAGGVAPGNLYRIYVYGCATTQGLFLFRIWYRSICRFFGVRKTHTQF